MISKKLNYLLAPIAVTALLAACAETPSAPAPAQQVSDAKPVAQTKICQVDYATGSHYTRNVDCETVEERDQNEAATRQQMDTFRALGAATGAH